jgi:thymidylate synthase ThyX
MPASVKILADSLNPEGVRLTTFEVSMHRYIWPEFMTHRVFSRNAQSNRAIPVTRLIEMVREDPAYPMHWGKNQKGMQAREEFDEEKVKEFREWWRQLANQAADNAFDLAAAGLHKQVVNRILEPFQWIRGIVTSTEWDNYFNLRCHEDAQPEIRWIAERMHAQLEESVPRCIYWGDWHLPLVEFDDEIDLSTGKLVRVCVARCARISYLTHDGVRDYSRDLDLHDQLHSSKHMSPFEHAAYASKNAVGPLASNFRNGWLQYRKLVENGSQLSID